MVSISQTVSSITFNAAVLCEGVQIGSSQIENCGAHGILVQDHVSRVRITDNEVRNTGLGFADRPGITASRNGDDVVVSNNIVIGSPSALGVSVHGISIDNTTNAVCNGNVVRGWKGMGIEVGFVHGGVFSGNTISACTYGIGLSGNETSLARNDDVSITGNTITDCSGPGLTSFILNATGVFLHRDINVNGNLVIRCAGDSGLGYWFRHIDGLQLGPNTAKDCAASGFYIEDCPNHVIDGVVAMRNNLEGPLRLVASITASGSTATATSTAHGFSNGDVISIWGASPTEFNQIAVISNTTSSLFEYPLPRTGFSSASGGIFAGKAKSGAQAGIRISWILFGVNDRGFNRIGQISAAYNGNRDFYDVNVNNVTGLINDKFFIRDSAVNPRTENLTSGITSNVRDGLAIEMKNGKFVVTYNNAGTLNYLAIPLDGSTTTWTQGAAVP